MNSRCQTSCLLQPCSSLDSWWKPSRYRTIISLTTQMWRQARYSVRVIILTQGPTLLTDLIVFCSITIIHRFSSPEWLAAVRCRILIVAMDREDLMQEIESLPTGMAIVHCPNAVLEQDCNRSSISGKSKPIKVSIRRRIKSDGGQSVLVVQDFIAVGSQQSC